MYKQKNTMKLNNRRTFFIGLAFLSIAAFWQMYDNIIPLILQNTFHLDETTTGVVMALDNILAVFLLPIIGTLSDKVDTKLGKRTPFIIGGTAVAVVSMALLPMADRNQNLIVFIVALAITLLAMAMYRSPAVALMPDLTPKPLRSKANAIINLMGAIGGIFTLLLIKLLIPNTLNPHYMPVFLGVGLLMIVAVVLLVLTTKEKRIAKEIAEAFPEQPVPITDEKIALNKDVKKSLILILVSISLWFTAYNAVTTAFSRYAIEVWGLQGGGFADCLLIATIAAILSYIPIGFVSTQIGRKKTILIGIILMFISYSMAFFFTSYHPIINVAFAMIGIGWAAISVNSLPMVVEMSRGSDVGKYTGLYYTFSMTAQIFTPIASGFLLQNVSYRVLFPYAALFTAFAFVTMARVRHGDAKPIKKENLLENYDIED